MNPRARHMLAGRIIGELHRQNGKLPSSKSVAVAAGVHPATARRWLADFRSIATLKASALTERARA